MLAASRPALGPRAPPPTKGARPALAYFATSRGSAGDPEGHDETHPGGLIAESALRQKISSFLTFFGAPDAGAAGATGGDRGVGGATVEGVDGAATGGEAAGFRR